MYLLFLEIKTLPQNVSLYYFISYVYNPMTFNPKVLFIQLQEITF